MKKPPPLDDLEMHELLRLLYPEHIRSDEDQYYELSQDACEVTIDLGDGFEVTLADLLARAIRALRPAHAADQWREAVEEMFAVNHIAMPEDPREAIKKLIATEVRDALDPTISSAAAALVQAGVPDDIVNDAQRYRWLRKSLPAGQGSLTVTLDDRCNGCFNKPVFMDSLDAAIDAAMLAAAKQGGSA